MSKSPLLRFRLRHRLAPIDPGDVEARRRPWLRQLALDDEERRHLVRCVFGAEAVVDEIFGGDFRFFQQRFTGFAEGPVEWWDISAGATRRYELFLFGADGGVLLAAGEARALGTVTGRAWQGDIVLALLLGHAQPAAIAEWPHSLIARVDFGWFA
jgi:hypothetical protein